MSRAAFALETDAGKPSSARMSSGVRVSKPGDTHEVEADRVADTVVRGGSVPGWSLAAKGFDGIQRKPAESHGDAVAQAEQALLASAEGRAAIAKVTAGAASGMVVTGAAAAGVVAALATGRKGTAGAASIALDGIHPGLSLKVAREGGAGGAEVALSYTPKTEGKHAAPGKVKAPAKLSEKKPEVHEPTSQKRDVGHPVHGTAHEGEKKEELTVHRKAERAEAMYTGSAEVDSVLRSPGREMEPATRREMESRIGFDFGRVRLHTDARAGESAQGLSARAYTVGSDVVFAPGRYAPQTTEGRHLLAHELTHVVQQTSGAERGRAAGLHVAKPAARVVQRLSVKDIPGAGWLLNKLKGFRGYHLFCVIVGKDLVDDKDVERNATTLTQGVLELFPGGNDLLALLKRAQEAIEAGYEWLQSQLNALHLDKESILSLLNKAWDAVSVTDLGGSWDRVEALLKEPIDHLLTLGAAIFEKLKDLILEKIFQAFPAGKKIWPMLKKAGAALSQAAADPVKFAKNLFLVVKGGFEKFAAKLADNLLEGLQAFVFEEIGIEGLTPPKDYQPETLLKMGLQVLGLTYAQQRPLLVKKAERLGSDGETTVAFFEKSVEIIQKVRQGGFTAIWTMITDKLKSIADSIFDAIEAWTIKEIVTIGMQHIAALANPVGDAIEIIRGIYEIINFFLEKATEMINFVESIVDTFANIVAGDVGGAAEKVKDTIKKSIPLILRFLAGLFGLSGFGASIRKTILSIKDKIGETIGKVLDFLVEKAKPYWDRGKEEFTKKLDAIKDWWTKPAEFHYGDEPHKLEIAEEGDNPEVYVNSDRSRLKVFLDDHDATDKQKAEALRLAKGLSWKEGKLESVSKKEAGYDNFVKLTKLMDNLKAKFPLKSVVNDRKAVHSDYLSAVSADAFLSDDLLSGSSPTGADPPAWTDLGYLLPPNPPYYVRGHLISEKLGGRGEWTNLMPITNAANGEMERTVEGPLKDAIASPKNKGKNYYHYQVTASYGNPKVPSEANATTKALRDARSDQAEKRLKRLTWKVTAAENDNGQWKDTGLVPRDAKGGTSAPMEEKVRSGFIEATQR